VDDFHKSETVSWFFWASETIFEEKMVSEAAQKKRFLMELLNLGHASTVWLFCRGGPAK